MEVIILLKFPRESKILDELLLIKHLGESPAYITKVTAIITDLPEIFAHSICYELNVCPFSIEALPLKVAMLEIIPPSK